MHKPRNHPGWSLEFAYLNVANSKFSGVNYTEKNIDILTHLPGTENYKAYTDLKTDVRTDFFGAGGSIKISESLFVGTSMFVSVNSKYSMYQLDINASPTSIATNEEIAYYNAKHETQEMVKFNDYRLLWKFGVFYKQPRFSAGLNITTPSVGGIYSDGKKVMRKQGQNNITNPETGIDWTVASEKIKSFMPGFEFITLPGKLVVPFALGYLSNEAVYFLAKKKKKQGDG
jgi:hypothetical protein